MTVSVGSAPKLELRKEKPEMSVKVINVQRDRMNPDRGQPDVSPVMLALEHEIF